MVTSSLNALKRNLKKKEAGIEKEIAEMSQQASARARKQENKKDRNEEILGFGDVFNFKR